MASALRLPSCCLLVLQGCFGAFPWRALRYRTLFLQLGGLSNLQASLVDVCAQAAGSAGSLLGGAVADGLARRSPGHGRALTAQLSVLASMPVVWLTFTAEPPAGGRAAYYAIMAVVFGLTATWYSGVNKPILSQIVRGDRRATVMAWAASLEGACATALGHVGVGFLAESIFGYELGGVAGGGDPRSDAKNGHALGSALAWMCICPWVLCLACHSLLHWSYPRDLRRLRKGAVG